MVSFYRYLRDRAIECGAAPINGLVTEIELPDTPNGKYRIHLQNFEKDIRVGVPEVIEADVVSADVSLVVFVGVPLGSILSLPACRTEQTADS